MAAIYAAIGGHWVRNGNAVPARYAPHGTSKQKKNFENQKEDERNSDKKKDRSFYFVFYR